MIARKANIKRHGDTCAQALLIAQAEILFRNNVCSRAYVTINVKNKKTYVTFPKDCWKISPYVMPGKKPKATRQSILGQSIATNNHKTILAKKMVNTEYVTTGIPNKPALKVALKIATKNNTIAITIAVN
jgi:hypothetical protein